MSTINDKSIRKYSSDLLSLLRHLHSAVKQQQSSEKVKEKEAIEILHQMNLRLSEQVDEFEAFVDQMGTDLKEEVKSKIANFTGSIAGLIDTARKDPVSKMLRDDYSALSMLAVGYKMLHTAALAGHNDDLAELTKNHLSVITRLIMEISKAVPMVVAREMIDDKKLAVEIGKKAVKNTQEVWSSENISAGPEIVEV